MKKDATHSNSNSNNKKDNNNNNNNSRYITKHYCTHTFELTHTGRYFHLFLALSCVCINNKTNSTWQSVGCVVTSSVQANKPSSKKPFFLKHTHTHTDTLTRLAAIGADTQQSELRIEIRAPKQ